MDVDKIVEQNVIPVTLHRLYGVDTFIMGYHAYKTLWTPSKDEELEAKMEPNNIDDKFAVALYKAEQLVGHLPKGKTGKNAKTIFFFLRASKDNSCAATITGKTVNEGDGKGMKVPCRLSFTGESKFIDVLKKSLPNN